MTKRFADYKLLSPISKKQFQAVAVEDNAANLEAVLEPEGEDEAPAETPEDPENVTDEPAEEAEAGEGNTTI